MMEPMVASVAPMQRPKLNLPIKARILLTLSLWLVAVLISACSTSIQISPQEQAQSFHEQPNNQPPLKITHHQKKQLFFAYLKPVIVFENNRVRLLRQQIIHLKTQDHLNAQQQAWLQHHASLYGVNMDAQPNDQQWQTLLSRVDIIPLDMALVQAANESAWGQSRFAQQGNNYFGQWCYQKGCGIVPRKRSTGAHHEVRRFASTRQSVRAYIHNINTSNAYREFRSIRHSLRVQSKPLDATVLVLGLKSYSERGSDYVRTLLSMLRSNRDLIRNS